MCCCQHDVIREFHWLPTKTITGTVCQTRVVVGITSSWVALYWLVICRAKAGHCWSIDDLICRSMREIFYFLGQCAFDDSDDGTRTQCGIRLLFQALILSVVNYGLGLLTLSKAQLVG